MSRGHESRPHYHDKVLRYEVTLQVCTHPNEPTVHAPRDSWMNIKTTNPSAILSTTNPTWNAMILTQTSAVRNQLATSPTSYSTHEASCSVVRIHQCGEPGNSSLTTRQMGLWFTAGRIPISGGITVRILYTYHSEDTVQVSQWGYCTSI